MHPLKIQVKLFAERDVHVESYVPVFHRWIRENVLPELLIDVVDYAHVHDGPAIMLIGHESDYALDRAGGRLGLFYANKRGQVDFPGALRRTFSAAALLAGETAVGDADRLVFRTNELSVRIADRLNAPNDDSTYERLLPTLRAGLEPLYGATGFELARIGSSRELFEVRVRASNAPDFSSLAARVAA